LRKFYKHGAVVEEQEEHFDYVTMIQVTCPNLEKLTGVLKPQCLKFVKDQDGNVRFGTKKLSTDAAYLPAGGQVILTKKDVRALRKATPVAVPPAPCNHAKHEEVLEKCHAKGLLPPNTMKIWRAYFRKEENLDAKCLTCSDLRLKLKQTYSSSRLKKDDEEQYKAIRAENAQHRSDLKDHLLAAQAEGNDGLHSTKGTCPLAFLANSASPSSSSGSSSDSSSAAVSGSPAASTSSSSASSRNSGGQSDSSESSSESSREATPIEIVQTLAPDALVQLGKRLADNGGATRLVVGQVAAVVASLDPAHPCRVWLAQIETCPVADGAGGYHCLVKWFENTSRGVVKGTNFKAVGGPYKITRKTDHIDVASIIATAIVLTKGDRLKLADAKSIGEHPMVAV
jgi:hypothetical protein